MKPKCKLVGQDGNIFNLMAIASRALNRAGMSKEASQMHDRIWNEAADYDHALSIIMEYLDVS